MRDWILPLAPVIAAAYFMVFPHQFAELVMWAQALVR
jgi:hypothetical protein